MRRELTAVLVAIGCVAPAARAQSDDVAAAEALFDEAMALMEAGEHASACPKLEESQRLDPGVGTLFNLARCYEETDRLASAWARYREAAQEAERRGQERRARAAERFARRLEDRLHRLVILVPNQTRVPGLRVEKDGEAVGEGAWGARVPVDRGEVVIRAEAPGRRPWTRRLTIEGPADLEVVEIPPLEPRPQPAPVPAAEPAVAAELEAAPEEPWHRDWVGWAMVGTGVALAAGGGYALVRAGSLEDDAGAPMIDLDERDRLLDSVDRHRTAGAVLIGGGAAVAAAGIVKLILTPPARERRSAILVGPRSVALRVRF